MIGVISHDAGGAEVLSSWIKENPGDYLLLLGGPAKEIFRKKLYKQYPHITDVADLTACKKTICSSGWQTDFEKKGIQFSLNNSVHTSVVLDHWNFYKERLIYEGKELIPHEIWVMDQESELIARNELKCKNISIKTNYYLNDSINEIAQLSKKNSNQKKTFLYLCDPIKDFANQFNIPESFWGYDEIDAINYFLKNITFFDNSFDELLLRKHPSESDEKYTWALSDKVKLSRDRSLHEDIAYSEMIFGCETYAIALAFKSGKDVLYTIPPEGRRSLIPYNIEYLSDKL